MAIEFGKKTLSDIQVFEYTDTLSLPVEAGCKLGDIVQVGGSTGIVGIQVTERGRTVDEEKALVEAVEAAGGVYVPATKGTQGLNKPGFASVRVHGGAFKLAVEGLAGDRTDIGKPVYADNFSGGKGKATMTSSDKKLGFVSNVIDATHAVVVLA